jgi:hypothetical protein
MGNYILQTWIKGVDYGRAVIPLIETIFLLMVK